MNTQRIHAALIHAWADGATIEYRASESDWIVSHYPSWDTADEYRVKPEPMYTVLAYKIVIDKDGLEETQRTTIVDPAATQWSLIRTDGVGYAMYTFNTYPDAYEACQAINKSTTFT